jgi:murein DD-endopeptidase MepM/ murein hydrolase activator NlpD
MLKLELFFPTDDYLCFQRFGECHPAVCSIYKGMGLDGHNGEDIMAKHGQIVRAAHDGVVSFAGEDGSAGYGVVIRTHDKRQYKEEGAYFKTIYWHLKKDGIKVKAGQHVKVGDIIALADNTGISTGDHLHFGLKPVYQGEQEWQWFNAEQDNGFKGAIDPGPYWSDLKAADYASISARLYEIGLLIAALVKKYSA